MRALARVSVLTLLLTTSVGAVAGCGGSNEQAESSRTPVKSDAPREEGNNGDGHATDQNSTPKKSKAADSRSGHTHTADARSSEESSQQEPSEDPHPSLRKKSEEPGFYIPVVVQEGMVLTGRGTYEIPEGENVSVKILTDRKDILRIEAYGVERRLRQGIAEVVTFTAEGPRNGNAVLANSGTQLFKVRTTR